MLCLFLSLLQSMRRAKKSLEFPPDHPGLLSDISSACPCDCFLFSYPASWLAQLSAPSFQIGYPCLAWLRFGTHQEAIRWPPLSHIWEWLLSKEHPPCVWERETAQKAWWCRSSLELLELWDLSLSRTGAPQTAHFFCRRMLLLTRQGENSGTAWANEKARLGRALPHQALPSSWSSRGFSGLCQGGPSGGTELVMWNQAPLCLTARPVLSQHSLGLS